MTPLRLAILARRSIKKSLEGLGFDVAGKERTMIGAMSDQFEQVPWDEMPLTPEAESILEEQFPNSKRRMRERRAAWHAIRANEARQETSFELPMTAVGRDTTITVDGQFVSIAPRGKRLGLQSQFRGERRIPISSVTSVEYKKPTVLALGYIHLGLVGDGDGGSLPVVKFVKKHEPTFEPIREYLESLLFQRMADQAMPQPQPRIQSVAKEISQLAELRDSGILSQSEFQTQKNRLLDS